MSTTRRREVKDECRLSAILGRATSTMLTSTRSMNAPRETVTSGVHYLRARAGGGGCAVGPVPAIELLIVIHDVRGHASMIEQ